MTFKPADQLTKLQDLNPTLGQFDDNITNPVDSGLSRWLKGAIEGASNAGDFDNYIDSNVRSILREYAEECAVHGRRHFTSREPIGAYAPRPQRIVTEKDIADYHRKEREGNRKLMLALREQNNKTMEAILGSR